MLINVDYTIYLLGLIALYTGDKSTPDETGKGYNLRIYPPRHSASRYTLSVFKKAAKKCKNLVNFGKWTARK